MGRLEYALPKSLRGKVAVVTGSNSGIGLETARELARLGCRVIMACRDLTKAEDGRADIVRDTGNQNVLVYQLDLSNFESVRSFVKKVSVMEDKLDILVNNAAMMHFDKEPSKVDEYGLDSVFTTNHYGPFLLTALLLPLLVKAAPSRIVMLSSVVYTAGVINDDVLRGRKHLSGAKSYSSSKLCNVIFTRELSRRLKGTGVTINAVHPGVIQTQIVRNLNFFLRIGYRVLSPIICKSTQQGAAPIIRLAVSEDVAELSGRYFDRFVEKRISSVATDEEATNMLWNISSEISGVNKAFADNMHNNNNNGNVKQCLS